MKRTLAVAAAVLACGLDGCGMMHHEAGGAGWVVLFDGRCGFCSRIVVILRSLDWLHRITLANYHDPDLRKRYAPGIDLKTLDHEMHVQLPDGTYKTGFFGFRALLGELPALWLLRPLLYTPGIPVIGKRVYAFVAKHR